MAERIDAVTIVGGGLAGWLSAVMLDRFLNTGADAPVRITVVESPSADAPTAGEATLPSLPNLLRQLGLAESEIFRRCGATFKLGVRCTGWDRDDDGQPRSFLLPHTEPPLCAGRSPALHHLAFGEGAPDYAEAALPASVLVEAGRAPRTQADGDYGARAGYGYHLDPEAFAQVLRETAVERGVQHVLAELAGVERDDGGDIAALTLADGGRHPVQLVLDTSGAIARDALGGAVEPAPTPNDRVIATHLPAPRAGATQPCTEIAALSAGWAWTLPLRGRIGAGCVYASRHLDDEDARRELLAHLNAPEDTPVRALPADFGWLRARWARNCVAVGPAAARHEPLDGVAIGHVNRAIRWLVYYWPDRGDPGPLRERYNTLMRRLDREIADFAATHYRLSNRADTAYWRETGGVPISDAHASNLDLWAVSVPGKDDLTRNAVFQAGAYTMLLFGKGFYRGRTPAKSRDLVADHWAEFRRKVEGAKMQMQRNLPEHDALLAAIRGERDGHAAGIAAAVNHRPAMP